MRIYRRWLVFLAEVMGIAVFATATELEPTNIEIILGMSESVPRGGKKEDLCLSLAIYSGLY